MNFKYFGTDGIRGVVGTPDMDEAFVRRFGHALGRYLLMRHENALGDIHLVIGRDTRESGEAFEKILIDTILPYGISIDVLGVVPTPAVSYWVDELEADNGVVLTASHNPAGHNGIKLFNAHGVKQTAQKEALIEPLIDEEPPELDKDIKPGELLYHEEAIPGYVDNICEVMPKGSLKGWKIVLDTANGSTYQTSRQVFDYFGAEVIQIGDKPNGKNINDGVGSENPEAFVAAVKEHGARLGIAHDGDGDRLLICDEEGEIVHGDQLLGILAIDMLEKQDLSNNILVATVMSNFGLDRAIEAHGGTVVRSDVGDRYVYQKMVEEKANLGGESSGHIIMSDFNHTGDGLLAAIKVLDILQEKDARLADLRKEIPMLPQVIENLMLKEKRPWEELTSLHEATETLKERLGPDGYVLVRYSGTEAKLRLMAQGPDEQELRAGIQSLKEAAAKDLELLPA